MAINHTDTIDLAAEAIETAGLRLGIEAEELAERLADGKIADLIIELRGLRHVLPHHSRARIEGLLRDVGVLTE